MKSSCRFGLLAILVASLAACSSTDKQSGVGQNWRPLPLIQNNTFSPDWFHTGWGTFTVDNGALRTDCDERGLGLLVYRKEKFGDCQIRVVYRAEQPRSNAGVYIRIDDGILKKEGEKTSPARRENHRLTPQSEKQMQQDSENEVGPWYAVHHGYEVQICDAADPHHRTGALYSLSQSSELPPKQPGEWRTMVITLRGNTITSEVDGKQVMTFDSSSTTIPPRKAWHEPKRELKRPEHGYIGLQNHDPGDVVWFKEVSVRALPDATK